MGGASTEVSDADAHDRPRGRVLGPAVHPPRRQGARHAHRGRHRFERGADPEAPPSALARIAHLAEKIGAGTHPPRADRPLRAPDPAAHGVLPLRARDRAPGRAGRGRRRAAHPDRPRLRGGQAGERRRPGRGPHLAERRVPRGGPHRGGRPSPGPEPPALDDPSGGGSRGPPARTGPRPAHARRPRRGRPRRGDHVLLRPRRRSRSRGARPRQPVERGPQGPARVAGVARPAHGDAHQPAAVPRRPPALRDRPRLREATAGGERAPGGACS